ncbi:WYL domain-containing protein [[Clostridium] symbiosum]|uniref:WYL domain-containing protein n=1 Tax=Clostridium symbiosum TaxID=1512 RepID=UPI001D09236E|nr:WYL domain-containing protein [[Clostridium] symbiosum]MCB6608065.1 WYL domain-containing protein [[Clostridium] symbiosum]MCB6931095.1 WYL domain-containing protein [[Clostridium] symbiosum]
MELFDKVYSCYYQVVRQILTGAKEQPLTEKQMETLIRKYGFQESVFAILPKLLDGEWALLKKEKEDGKTYSSAVDGELRPPLTLLQKSWLKSLLADRRIGMFLDERERGWADEALKEVMPLYNEANFYYYDRYSDGDDYESEPYRKNFRTVLSAIKQGQALFIAYEGKQKDTFTYEVLPYQLQYSSKDDKFRLCCRQYTHRSFCREILLNMSRIRACHPSNREVSENVESFRFRNGRKSKEPVVIEISGERNSLERCMLHFASYEKHTEFDGEKNTCRCSIYYDRADETELLIDILSFGPVVRVLGPEPFLNLIRARVGRQHRMMGMEAEER